MTTPGTLGADGSALRNFINDLEDNAERIAQRTVRVTIYTTTSARRVAFLTAAAVARGRSLRFTRTLGPADTPDRVDAVNLRSEGDMRRLLEATERLGLEFVACDLEDLA